MCVLSRFGRCHKTVVLNLSWFVTPLQRLRALLAPCSTTGFCNITAELFSKGVCSWPPGNRSVVRGLRLRNPIKRFLHAKRLATSCFDTTIKSHCLGYFHGYCYVIFFICATAPLYSGFFCLLCDHRPPIE